MNQWYEKFLNFLGFEPDLEGKDLLGEGVIAPYQEGMEMHYLHPKTYDEVTSITDALNGGHCAIVDLTSLSKEEAKRLTDFAYGSVYAVQGNVNRLGEKLFLFTPRNVSFISDNSELLPPKNRVGSRENRAFEKKETNGNCVSNLKRLSLGA